MLILGLDAEFFISDINGNTIAPSMLKQNTLNKIKTTNNLSIDGIHLEINPSPFTCREDATRQVKLVMLDLREILRQENYLLSPEIARKFSPATFKKFTDDDKKLGCKPSYNTYTKSISKIPNNAERLRFRSAGGHLHLGIWYLGTFDCEEIDSDCTKGTKLNPQSPDRDYQYFCEKRYGRGNFTPSADLKIMREPKILIKLLDLFIGVPITLLENESDRRRIYGRAGEYRPTDYGIEYRVASSLIIRDPMLYSMFLGWARAAFRLSRVYYDDQADKYLNDLIKISDKKIQDAINNNDKKLLKELFVDGIGAFTQKSLYSDILRNNSIYKKSIVWYLGLLLNQPKQIKDPDEIWNNWAKYNNRNGIDTELAKRNYSSQYIKDIKNKWRKFGT